MNKDVFVSASCEGEVCLCGSPAIRKIGEEIPHDDPLPNRHNLTAYVCGPCFARVLGVFAARSVGVNPQHPQSPDAEPIAEDGETVSEGMIVAGARVVIEAIQKSEEDPRGFYARLIPARETALAVYRAMSALRSPPAKAPSAPDDVAGMLERLRTRVRVGPESGLLPEQLPPPRFYNPDGPDAAALIERLERALEKTVSDFQESQARCGELMKGLKGIASQKQTCASDEVEAWELQDMAREILAKVKK